MTPKEAIKGRPVAQSDTEPVLDFSDVKGFEPLDESRLYLCTVSDCKAGKAGSGYGKVHVELTINKPEDNAKRKLFREYSTQSQALPFLYEFIKAVDSEAELGENFRFKGSSYIGLQCAVKVFNEEYQGTMQSRIKKVLPASVYQD